MKQRGSILPLFIISLLIALVLFFFATQGFLKGPSGFFEQLLLPVQRLGYSMQSSNDTTTSEATLREENRKLQTELAQRQELVKENKALRDQFETTKPSSRALLPAKIIGARDDGFLIDKGTADGIMTGDIVIYKDNLVGKIGKASTHMSIVYVLMHKDISFTAQTVKTDSLGIVQGSGGSVVVLDKVVLSDKLAKGDIVITKGDIDDKGKGFPPDLIVGKIVSVNKKASALFQQAEVKSLVDFSRLETVFVMTKNQ